MSKLYIVTGLPYAGKSILTKALKEKYGFASASVDDAMEESGYESDTMTQADWNEVYTKAYDRLKQCLAEGKTVIFDGGSLKKSNRDTLRNIAQEQGVNSILIYINTTREEILKRWQDNQTTNERDHLPETSLNRAFDMFEEPSDDEKTLLYNQGMDLGAWLAQNIR